MTQEKKSKASWYKQGKEGEEAAREEEARRSSESSQIQRFWIKPNTSTRITFLDSDGFFFREHQLNLNNSWLNWFTCLSDFDECPLCEAGIPYSYVCAFTILDHSKFTTKKGETVTIRKKLLVVKGTVRSKIMKQKQYRDGDLTFCHYDVQRFGEQDYNTGSDFEFLRRLSRDELVEMLPEGAKAEEWLKPYDYTKIFEPKSPEELRRIINVKPPVGSEPDTEGIDRLL